MEKKRVIFITVITSVIMPIFMALLIFNGPQFSNSSFDTKLFIWGITTVVLVLISLLVMFKNLRHLNSDHSAVAPAKTNKLEEKTYPFKWYVHVIVAAIIIPLLFYYFVIYDAGVYESISLVISLVGGVSSLFYRPLSNKKIMSRKMEIFLSIGLLLIALADILP